jgi:hypothetical protein
MFAAEDSDQPSVADFQTAVFSVFALEHDFWLDFGFAA